MRMPSPASPPRVAADSSPIDKEASDQTSPGHSQKRKPRSPLPTNLEAKESYRPRASEPIPALSTAEDISTVSNIASFIASQHQPLPSHKPLHEIGSLLNTLVETARSIVVAQPSGTQGVNITSPSVSRPKSSRHQRRPRIISMNNANAEKVQIQSKTLLNSRAPTFRTVAAHRPDHLGGDSVLTHGQDTLLNFFVDKNIQNTNAS